MSTVTNRLSFCLCFLFFFPLLVSAQKNKEIKECHLKESRSTYTIENGMLNGEYLSFHPNGVKRAEGQFEHNMRSGLWTIWDSTGNMLHKRLYSGVYAYNVIFPVLNEKDADFVTKSPILKQNTEGYLEFPPTKDSEIMFSKRYWRQIISKKQNPALFENDHFFSLLKQGISNEKIKAYSVQDDRFTTILDANDFIKKVDSLDYEVVSYRLKEHYSFNVRHQTGQTTILGLAVVARLKNSNNPLQDTTLFWVNIPSIRKVLAKEKVVVSGLPTDIKTYDDLFFKRYFSSKIYKESNVKNQDLENYVAIGNLEETREKIEIDLIESEHNFWVHSLNLYAKR